MKDFAERFDKIHDLSDAICGSDRVEQELFWDAYSLASDAMEEVKNLTAEIERLNKSRVTMHNENVRLRHRLGGGE